MDPYTIGISHNLIRTQSPILPLSYFEEVSHHAGHGVRVAAREFRAARDHQVGAQVERPHQQPRHQRVVNAEKRARRGGVGHLSARQAVKICWCVGLMWKNL